MNRTCNLFLFTFLFFLPGYARGQDFVTSDIALKNVIESLKVYGAQRNLPPAEKAKIDRAIAAISAIMAGKDVAPTPIQPAPVVAAGNYIGPVKPSATPGGLPNYSFKVGDVGNVGNHTYTVQQVGSNFMLVGIGRFTFMVANVETKGFANGTSIELPGTWEVRTATPYQGQTYFVIIPKGDGAVRIK